MVRVRETNSIFNFVFQMYQMFPDVQMYRPLRGADDSNVDSLHGKFTCLHVNFRIKRGNLEVSLGVSL